MTREIVLLVLLSSGESEMHPYKQEWPCITQAARENAQGREAWCIIQTPSKRGKSEKYPD